MGHFWFFPNNLGIFFFLVEGVLSMSVALLFVFREDFALQAGCT